MSSQIFKTPIIQEQKYNEENYSEMKLYIQKVESALNNFKLENENLKQTISNLEKEKLNLSSNLEQKDISLSELTQIFENLKRKENEYEIKISELEKKNEELNYKILELTQKNKSLLSTNETLIQNPNFSNDKKQLLELTEKLDETEISKQKIEFEKKMLENKINDLQNQHENEIKLLSKLKNGEIQQLQKTISSLTNDINNNMKKISFLNENNNNLNNGKYSQIVIEQVSNLENKIKLLNEEIYNLKKENKLLNNQYIDSNIANEHKDRFIEELQNRISEIEENFNLKINKIQIDSENNITQFQESKNQVEQLLIEREELLKQNRDLRNGFEIFNVNIKEANDLFNQKTQSFSNIINSYNLKLKEYKNKIIQLKKKVNELFNENQKYKKQIEILKENKQKLIEGKLINKSLIPKRSPSYPSYKINNSYNSNLNINYTPLSSNNNNLMRNNINLNGMNNINSFGINSINNNINDDIYFKNLQNQNLNYMNNTNINRDNFYMKNIKDLPSDSVANVNIINKIDDPYSLLQQKSLLDFKKVLNRIDMELIKNKEIRKENTE